MQEKKERETIDKKPYYIQSSVVFVFIGVTFLLLGAANIYSYRWMSYLAIAVMIVAIIYAIVSSVYIEKNKKSNK